MRVFGKNGTAGPDPRGGDEGESSSARPVRAPVVGDVRAPCVDPADHAEPRRTASARIEARRPLRLLTPDVGTTWPRRPKTIEGVPSIDALRAGQVAPPECRVDVPGLPAPVWLPLAASSLRRAPFADYVAALRRADVHAAPSDLEALDALTTRAAHARLAPTPPRSEAPRVAILVSEVSALLGDAGLDALVARARAGGADVVLIPPVYDVVLPDDPALLRAALARYVGGFDAVIGPGGADVHPRLYRERTTHAVRPNFVRDRAEANLLRAALEAECFVLGFCRSHQLVNAALGGKLAQDVRADGLSALTQNQLELGLPKDAPFVVRDTEGRVLAENRVVLTPGSDAHALADGQASILTNSIHHQAVTHVGRGLAATGVVRDPVLGVETIEVTEGRNVLTTQFHPELMTTDPVMARLADTALRRAHVFAALRTGTRDPSGDVGATVASVERRLAARGQTLEAADRAWLVRWLEG